MCRPHAITPPPSSNSPFVEPCMSGPENFLAQFVQGTCLSLPQWAKKGGLADSLGQGEGLRWGVNASQEDFAQQVASNPTLHPSWETWCPPTHGFRGPMAQSNLLLIGPLWRQLGSSSLWSAVITTPFTFYHLAFCHLHFHPLVHILYSCTFLYCHFRSISMGSKDKFMLSISRLYWKSSVCSYTISLSRFLWSSLGLLTIWG